MAEATKFAPCHQTLEEVSAELDARGIAWKPLHLADEDYVRAEGITDGREWKFELRQDGCTWLMAGGRQFLLNVWLGLESTLELLMEIAVEAETEP